MWMWAPESDKYGVTCLGKGGDNGPLEKIKARILHQRGPLCSLYGTSNHCDRFDGVSDATTPTNLVQPQATHKR